MPISHENVRPTVVVHVEECCAPTHERITGLRQLRVPTDVGETTHALIPVQRVWFVGKIRNEHIQLSIMIEVGEIDSH